VQKFLPLPNGQVMLIQRDRPLTVFQGNWFDRHIVIGTPTYGEVLPRFDWLAKIIFTAPFVAQHIEMQYMAINSVGSPLGAAGLGATHWGNFWFGYGAYLSGYGGVSILRGATTGCVLKGYPILGGTLESLVPWGTDFCENGVEAITNTGYVQLTNTTTVVPGVPPPAGVDLVDWDIADIKVGDYIVIQSDSERDVMPGNRPWPWPNFEGGWGTNSRFRKIVAINYLAPSIQFDMPVSIAAGHFTLNDNRKYAILRLRGDNIIRWPNNAALGGYSDWNATGEGDGSYRLMDWGTGGVLAMETLGDFGFAFKEDAIARIRPVGGVSTFDLEHVSDKIGTSGGPNSIVKAFHRQLGDVIFFPFEDNFFAMNAEGAITLLDDGHQRVWGGWGEGREKLATKMEWDFYDNRLFVDIRGGERTTGAWRQNQLIYGLNDAGWTEHNVTSQIVTLMNATASNMFCSALRVVPRGFAPQAIGIGANLYASGSGPPILFLGLGDKEAAGPHHYAIGIIDYDPSAISLAAGWQDAFKRGAQFAPGEWISVDFDLDAPHLVKELIWLRLLGLQGGDRDVWEYPPDAYLPRIEWDLHSGQKLVPQMESYYGAYQAANEAQMKVSANRFRLYLKFKGDYDGVVGTDDRVPRGVGLGGLVLGYNILGEKVGKS